MKTLIRAARVIDPACGRDETGDILIENGRIAAVGRDITAQADEIIDAAGLAAAPRPGGHAHPHARAGLRG